MTWSLSMSGHGNPNDDANREARTKARDMVQQLQSNGQTVSTATFTDNEGTHDLTKPESKAGA